MPDVTYGFKFKPSSTVIKDNASGSYTIPANFYALVQYSTNATGQIAVTPSGGGGLTVIQISSSGSFWLVAGDAFSSTAGGWGAVVSLFPV